MREASREYADNRILYKHENYFTDIYGKWTLKGLPFFHIFLLKINVKRSVNVKIGTQSFKPFANFLRNQAPVTDQSKCGWVNIKPISKHSSEQNIFLYLDGWSVLVKPILRDWPRTTSMWDCFLKCRLELKPVKW